MIALDLNKDSISEYFSSFQEFNSLPSLDNNESLTYGPGCNDWVSWRDFWTPATPNTKFRVAKFCGSCVTSTVLEYDQNVAYYMTNDYFTLSKIHINKCARDELTGEAHAYTYNTNDRTSSMCNICDYAEDGKRGSPNWLECSALQLSADTVAAHSIHDKSLLQNYMLVQPSVAGDHSYCTCYQPMDGEINTYMVDENELPIVNKDYQKNNAVWKVDGNIKWDVESETNDCSVKYYLSSVDFLHGTYKIQVCGEYILTEDIIISFNAPSAEVQASDDFSPNSIDVEDLYWYPTTAQQESNEYPGSDAFHGIFQLGFFTGISIQTNDVTINLNGFKIEMDMKYYLQQRVFSIIELGNRNFIKNQGQALDLGKSFILVSNIVIKDGSIGRVSHHGIHGNEARNVHISNVKISNFDVAGIHLNGCSDVKIADVVVGPQSSDIPVLGRYLHGRAILPRMRYFVDLFGDEVIPFGKNNIHKESKTVKELVETLITEMDLIYFHIINDVVHKSKDWISAKSLFLNKNGWLDGGSAYGIVINGHGTGVTCFGLRDKTASDIILQNVEIFGIALSAEERFFATVAKYNHQMHGFFFDALDWVKITADDGRYVGDAYTDLVFAANELMQDELCFLNTLSVTPVRDWVFNDDQSIKVKKAGGSDMQSHDAKGAMGLRVDQTQSFTANNLYVHDITNYAVLGNTECCGEWEVITFVTMTYVDIEPGYTGTRAHGIVLDFMEGSFTDIVIENVESHFGSAVGMSLYKGSEISKLENIEITGINAGSKLTSKEALALTLPNMLPFACSLEFGVNTDVPDIYPIIIKNMNEDSIVGRNIYGFDVCEDERLVGSIVNDEQAENVKLGGSDILVNYEYSWFIVLLVFLFILGIVYFFYIRCRAIGDTNIEKKFERTYGAIDFHADI